MHDYSRSSYPQSRWQWQRWRCWSLFVLLLLTHAAASDPNSHHKAALVFQAQCQLVSDTCGDDPQELREFLERPAIRNLFLSAGGKRPCQSVSIHSNIVDLWHQACEKYYGMDALPKAALAMRMNNNNNNNNNNKGPNSPKHQKEEIAVLATETEVHFPGFKTINTVLNGCHLFPKRGDDDENDGESNGLVLLRRNHGNPKNHRGFEKKDVVHKFYLVGDKKRWVGPAPVVWLVRKLTGDDGSNNATYKPSETRATSQVSVYIRDDNNKDTTSITSTTDGTLQQQQQRPNVGFQLDIECAVKVEFPQFLLRILPAPRSKVEERGTEAIRKAILQDATSAMQAVEEAWAKEQDKRQSFHDRSSKNTKSWVYSSLR